MSYTYKFTYRPAPKPAQPLGDRPAQQQRRVMPLQAVSDEAPLAKTLAYPPITYKFTYKKTYKQSSRRAAIRLSAPLKSPSPRILNRVLTDRKYPVYYIEIKLFLNFHYKCKLLRSILYNFGKNLRNEIFFLFIKPVCGRVIFWVQREKYALFNIGRIPHRLIFLFVEYDKFKLM